ncbi:MAG: rRNA maturation RNase YbeY [Bdellovibrionaceae bacterium]|nr:rRNA maturation RNase YbeY [Pseudobdellovibrionaceae bacterium]
MTIHFIKQGRYYIPKAFLKQALPSILKELKKAKLCPPAVKTQIHLVFVSSQKMKTINKKYRNKNKTTDILSFSLERGRSFGELVFDYSLVKKQALQNGHAIKQELLYLFIHGLLHLLGLDHEKSLKEEKRMYKIQDSIFASLQKK